MLVPNDIHDSIGSIIERAYTGFTYAILGKDFLTPEQITQVEALGLLVGRRPLLELIYIMVKARSEKRYQTTHSLDQLLQEIFATGILPKLPETSQFTIDSAMANIDQVIAQARANTASVVTREIKNFNQAEQVIERTRIVPVSPLVKREEDSSKIGLLIAAIGIGLVAVNSDFERDFTGELTTLVNQAAIDVAFEEHGSEAVEQLCYKVVVNDSRICFHCHPSYLNEDGTPRIYKLGSLLANGSNFGKPKSAWLPSAGPDHYRCRCQLMLLGSKPSKL